MLLTNQKTINYEIYINSKGNHPFCFASAKIDRKFKKEIEKGEFNITFAKKASFYREFRYIT
jgi:hypothetical protein